MPSTYIFAGLPILIPFTLGFSICLVCFVTPIHCSPIFTHFLDFICLLFISRFCEFVYIHSLHLILVFLPSRLMTVFLPYYSVFVLIHFKCSSGHVSFFLILVLVYLSFPLPMFLYLLITFIAFFHLCPLPLPLSLSFSHSFSLSFSFSLHC